MTTGRLVAVVGASGVGKDSVIEGIVRTAPEFRRVRRTITRARDAVGEEHEAVTAEGFDDAVRNGAFCLHWSAHGHRYGIPASVLDDVLGGKQYIANFSRNALVAAMRLFPSMTLLNITAAPKTLEIRLSQRGRENEAEIAARLQRVTLPLPAGLDVIDICNDGPLEQTVAHAVELLRQAYV